MYSKIIKLILAAGNSSGKNSIKERDFLLAAKVEIDRALNLIKSQKNRGNLS